MTITIKDETLAGKLLNEIGITVIGERLFVKDIIAARVEAEVTLYNNQLPEYFKGLVQPSETEETLNGFKMKNRKLIDVEQQTFVAYDAFQKNGYFILVDDNQVESLEQEVKITPNTIISFIKLTPLVGG